MPMYVLCPHLEMIPQGIISVLLLLKCMLFFLFSQYLEGFYLPQPCLNDSLTGLNQAFKTA